MTKKVRPLSEYFADIEDTRIDRCKKRRLLDVIVITLLVTISEAEGWEDIQRFAEARKDGERHDDLPSSNPNIAKHCYQIDPNNRRSPLERAQFKARTIVGRAHSHLKDHSKVGFVLLMGVIGFHQKPPHSSEPQQNKKPWTGIATSKSDPITSSMPNSHRGMIPKL